MRIIEINALENGAHRNQNGSFKAIPDGWALIPDELEVPNTFPFVNITVDGQTVTAIEAGAVPEAEETVEPESNLVTWDALAAAYSEGVNSIDE